MTLYIILLFITLCAGMVVSVYAFGTGGKRKRIFQDIYFSVEETNGVGVLYTKTGEYSAVLKIENPVQKYCANIDNYYEYTHLFTAIAQTLGEGYAIHKQDIFMRKQFEDGTGDGREFLSSAYFRYFKGRNYTDSVCYLTITQEAKKSRLFSYDGKQWRDFLVKIRKVHDQLRDGGVQAKFLNKAEASEYVDRYFAMNFKDRIVSMTNFKADEETVSMGDKRCKVYSLVDVDYAALPSLIRPYTNIEVNNTEMPVDLVSVIDSIPNADTVVYNQIIYLPNQKRELALLDKKKNRHASIPNPSNQMAVEDIKRVQEVIARESRQLVYTHFNLIVAVPADTDLQKCTNHLENAFGRMGIHISKHAYNQLELFVGSFPGNCYGMSEEYDRFLTLGDAAMCLMYKERIQHSEETPLKIYYTDRQGVPVAIDITGKEGKNITEYYDTYFNGFDGFTPMQREDLRKSLVIDDRNRSERQEETELQRTGRIERMIDEMERRRKELKVEELSFNSFYEFSVQRIPDICDENHISGIDISTYRYMMKDFYRGGNHDKTLNENMDSSLFDETFIVFEIDSIKDDPLLFPLVTLIIMDVFLQKMRIKKNRKVLVIEEAWKAIASPLMAEYIKFMCAPVQAA